MGGGVYRLRKVGAGCSGESKYGMYKRMKSQMYMPYTVVFLLVAIVARLYKVTYDCQLM